RGRAPSGRPHLDDGLLAASARRLHQPGDAPRARRSHRHRHARWGGPASVGRRHGGEHRGPRRAREPGARGHRTARGRGRHVKRWLPHFGIALGVAIAIYALFFAESAEDRIRSQLDALEEALVVTGTENPVLRAARIKKAFEALMLPEVHFEIPELAEGDTGRNELVRL